MRLKYIKNNDPVKIDQNKCTGCGICIEVCPHGVISMTGGKAYPSNADYCMGCGGCLMNCPAGAVAAGTGVGCAAAVFNSIWPGKKLSACDCSCSIDNEKQAGILCGGSEDKQTSAAEGLDCCFGEEKPVPPAAPASSSCCCGNSGRRHGCC